MFFINGPVGIAGLVLTATTRGPRKHRTGRPLEIIEDKLEFIAARQAVAIIPAALHVGSIRPELTTIPLQGVEPGHVVPATPGRGPQA